MLYMRLVSRSFFSSIPIERQTDESHLIEYVMVVSMILSHYESNESDLYIVDIGLFQLSGLVVGVGIGIEGYSS